MSQNDLVIANQSFPATRADINSALQALGSLNSGATEPATTYAHMPWSDTTTDILKVRSAANDAWISIGYLDQIANTFKLLDDVETVSGVKISEVIPVSLGTAGQFLAVNAGATAGEWADGVDVATETAALGAGAVGTYAFLRDNTTRVATYTAGTNYAGSQLAYTGMYSGSSIGVGMQYAGGSGAGVSGTWQAMGSATHPSASLLHHTLFLRVA
jgi:hypothetical protein